MELFKKRTYKEYILYTAVIALGVILDQLTKFLVFKFMTIGQSIPLIENFLHLTYTTNDGAAFGMLDARSTRWIFIAVSAISIIEKALLIIR